MLSGNDKSTERSKPPVIERNNVAYFFILAPLLSAQKNSATTPTPPPKNYFPSLVMKSCKRIAGRMHIYQHVHIAEMNAPVV